jgi:hypothetical protein
MTDKVKSEKENWKKRIAECSSRDASILFDIAANWSYDCTYHSSMTGTINVNAPPELNNGTVDPGSGDKTTWFNFTVDYLDANGNDPKWVYVNIDGTNHTMAQINDTDSDFTDGAEFYYETQLSGGTHTYHFIANDHYVTNSTTSESTGTVVPEFGLLPVMITLALIGAVAVGWRRKQS